VFSWYNVEYFACNWDNIKYLTYSTIFKFWVSDQSKYFPIHCHTTSIIGCVNWIIGPRSLAMFAIAINNCDYFLRNMLTHICEYLGIVSHGHRNLDVTLLLA